MITKARKLILVNYYCLNDRLYLNFPMSLPSPNIHSRVSRCIVVSACVCAQSCPALCDPVDCSPPGSSVHGMFQARILELVPLPPSRGCFQHREGTWPLHLLPWQVDSSPPCPLGSPRVSSVSSGLWCAIGHP